MKKIYFLTLSLDEGVLQTLQFEADSIQDFMTQFFPHDDSEKFLDFTQHIDVDRGSYYNRTPITPKALFTAIADSHVDGDSEYRVQIFEFEHGNPTGKEVTYDLIDYF